MPASPGRRPIPGWARGGVIARATSIPTFIHTPSSRSWIAATIDDFPDRGVPLRITICLCAVEPLIA